MILYFQAPPLKPGRAAAEFPLRAPISGPYRANQPQKELWATRTSDTLGEGGETNTDRSELVPCQEL